MQRAIAIKAGDLTFLGVALTLMIALAVTSYLIAPPQTADLRGSTYSAKREGAKAAFLLLKRLGFEVERSYEPIAAIHAKPEDTVLVLASPARRASLQDLRALKTFIEHGGMVIATGGGGSFLPNLGSVSVVEMPSFLRREGLATKDKPLTQESHATPYEATMPSVLTRGVPKLLLESEIVGTAPAPSSYAMIYRDATGPGVLAASFGDGYAIWMIGATPFLNGEIDKPGNLEFMLNAIGGVAGARTVLWDEYYHGYDRGLISYFATTQISTAFAQMALIAMMALFTFSRRHGPLRPLLVRPRASAMEFVDAMSGLYQKARAGSGAVETMRARLRRVLITAAQVPANASDAQLSAAAAVRYPIDERGLRELLAESASASDDPDLQADRALTLVQRMQTVVQRVQAS